MKLIQQLAPVRAPGIAPKITSWTSGGEPVQVITEKQEGETYSAFCQAHDEAVAAAKLLWPCD